MSQHLSDTGHSFSASHLAPGASTLLATLENGSGHQPIDTSKLVREMNVQDWAALVQAFHSWPFAPEVNSQLQKASYRCSHFHDLGFAYNRFVFSRRENIGITLLTASEHSPLETDPDPTGREAPTRQLYRTAS